MKKFDLKVASAGTVESFVQSSSAQGGMESKSVLGGQALLQKLEADLEALESHLLELNTYNERLTSEYNEKVRGVDLGLGCEERCVLFLRLFAWFVFFSFFRFCQVVFHVVLLFVAGVLW